jgi:H+/Cl- antiporter ClcA
LYPRTTLALAALAVAALGNLGLRVYHLGDASIMVLVWHFGSVVMLSLIAGLIGKLLLNWKKAGNTAAN